MNNILANENSNNAKPSLALHDLERIHRLSKFGRLRISLLIGSAAAVSALARIFFSLEIEIIITACLAISMLDTVTRTDEIIAIIESIIASIYPSSETSSDQDMSITPKKAS